MRQRISEKNIFPSFDLFGEYKKLEDIFSEWHTIGVFDRYGQKEMPIFTFEQYIGDLQFSNWNLRGTFISLQEMRKAFHIAPEDFDCGSISEGQLLDFVQFLLNCCLRIRSTIQVVQSQRIAFLAREDALEMLFQNCRYVLEKLNCEDKLDKENYEIYVVNKDELSSEVSQQNPDVEISLTDYRRIDNRGDLQRKGEILCTLSKRLEAVESKIKGTEFHSTYNDATFLLNKIGARHWTGKDKLANATFMKMSPEELEKWYDTAFDLVVSCLAAIPYLAVKDKIKDIKKTGADE